MVILLVSNRTGLVVAEVPTSKLTSTSTVYDASTAAV